MPIEELALRESAVWNHIEQRIDRKQAKAYLTLEGPTERVAAISVPVADTTGAGDTFVGCFLAAWLNGDAPSDAGRLAAVAAGLSVSTEGTQGACIGMETLADYGILAETARAYRLPGTKTASTPSG